ncbi:uncharacterized protein LOC132751321 [Ruditapes philippinarum]|uniref:uncharacterized protein LOC132751321 n=1 Tax=Ruditapes philippinarum TaxID=129788 RepID=UPI00295A6CDE|nr:uncharacterized protein LOC132751321 [Ruditapes philippinarum]
MAIKKKERERRLFASKTGGGPPPANPDSLEEKVLQLIGESTVAGISGVDTFRENLSSSISNMSNVQEASCTNDGDADASSSGNLAESAPSATLVNTSNSVSLIICFHMFKHNIFYEHVS